MKRQIRYAWLVLALLASHHGPALGNGEPVRVGIEPQPVLVERTASGQMVSFDFLIENLGAETVRLARIELSVYDRRGDRPTSFARTRRCRAATSFSSTTPGPSPKGEG